MANAFKRVANYLGLVDDEADMQVAPEVKPQRGVRPVNPTAAPKWVPTSPPVQIRPAPISVQAELPVLDSIFTIHPRFYSEARTVGEHFREGQPVLMNLSDMDESERKRLVDFASGLVFGHRGSIERITPKVFLLTPPNIRVSTENKTAAAEASFFNQS